MKKLMPLILTLLAILFILISCSNNTTEPTDTYKSYFPLSLNSYWLYERYLLDEQGKPIDITKVQDSLVIMKTALLLNKNCFQVATYDFQNQLSDTNFYYYEADAYYTYSDYINNLFKKVGKAIGFDIPIRLGNKWLKIADFKSQTWQIAVDTIPDIEIMQGVTIGGVMTITGEKGASTQENVLGTLTNVQQFIIRINFAGKIKSAFLNGDVPINFVIYNYYAKDFGLYITKNDKTNIDYKIGTATIDASESKLIKYFKGQ